MFGTGGSALIAKTMGQGDRERANDIFSMIVYASAACGVVLAGLGFLILRPAAVLMGAEGELLEQALIYGRINLIALPFYVCSVNLVFFSVSPLCLSKMPTMQELVLHFADLQSVAV